MHRALSSRPLATALLLAAIGGVPSIVKAEDETLEDILAVWRTREAAVKTVRVEFDEDHLTGKGTHIEGGPPGDQVCKTKRTIVIDGLKMRQERIGELWADAIGDKNHLTYVAVFDGTGSKKLWRTARNDDVMHSRGWIRNADKPPDLHNIYLSTVVRHFRPLSPVFGSFRLQSLKLISTDERVNGARCVVLEEEQEHKHWTRKYWIAPDQEMAIVRLVGTRPDGTVSHQVDSKFKRDAKLGWLPTAWKVVNLGRRKVLSSGDATITHLAINEPVPATTFDIQFPAGTEVEDRIKGTKFLVKPDGSRRKVMQREVDRGARYSELMATDSGDADGLVLVSRFPNHRQIVFSTVLVGVVVLAMFAGRSRLFPRR